jgi:hypothetical protein
MSASVSRCEERPAVAAPWSDGLFRSIGNIYCRVFHRTISRPVAGKYRCWKCLREFELNW